MFRYLFHQGQAHIRREEGAGRERSGTQKIVYQKWPNQIFPIVNLIFFQLWSLWSAGGDREGWGVGGLLLWLSAF